MDCYDTENGRPGVEPVVLLGVLILPVFGKSARPPSGGVGEVSLGLEASVELEVERRRFSPHDVGRFGDAGGISCLTKRGLDPEAIQKTTGSTHVLSAVSDLSALECVRETLRLALDELGRGLAKSERPDFWELFWERYVESKLDLQEWARGAQKQASSSR